MDGERPGSADDTGGPGSSGSARSGTATDATGARDRVGAATARKGSGRQKHDAKITVYVSADELLAMEHTRLALRGSHGLVVDRGRIVREAVAVLLADFEDHGEDSVLVRRLRDDEADSGASRGSGGEETAD
ncbi:cobyrinic acid a,c-diamide synthase [Saccharomonospora saliphila]|uniref:cobyrinic acid a,c-diamide synthase n=1 Tax=Saccharomonospora saliphila TaxID=369829 RepID=UPI001E62EAEA|nr:cobyrinic acid a,c-diamide synthase [Saccharomonospora saliphila]